MTTISVAGSEKRIKSMVVSNFDTCSFVISERMGIPKYFWTGIAGIFEPLNVLFNVLFHMLLTPCGVITLSASITATPLRDH